MTVEPSGMVEKVDYIIEVIVKIALIKAVCYAGLIDEEIAVNQDLQENVGVKLRIGGTRYFAAVLLEKVDAFVKKVMAMEPVIDLEVHNHPGRHRAEAGVQLIIVLPPEIFLRNSGPSGIDPDYIRQGQAHCKMVIFVIVV